MIFNGSKVTAMVMQWQQTRDPALLERILADSKSLIEAIISGYGSYNREDLIQDATAKLIFSLPYYSTQHGTLHNYFTTVIRNSSATSYKREERHDYDELILSLQGKSQQVAEEDILQELLTFGRIRFPSLPVRVIDNMVEYIYEALQYDHAGKSRGIVSALISEYDVSRNIAYAVYNSIIIYLRKKYSEYCEDPDGTEEFSILTDLKNIVGEELYKQLSTIFSNMYIKFP